MARYKLQLSSAILIGIAVSGHTASATLNPYYNNLFSSIAGRGTYEGCYARDATLSSKGFSPALFQGQRLASPTGNFYLIMQTDGNLVLYGASDIWSTRTVNLGFFAMWQRTDNNFVVYSKYLAGQWDLHGNCYVFNEYADMMAVQGDGNFVMYGSVDHVCDNCYFGCHYSTCNAMWSTGTNGRAPAFGNSGSEVTWVQSDYMVNSNVYKLVQLDSQSRWSDCANLCVQDRQNHCVAYTYYTNYNYGVTTKQVPAYGCFLRNDGAFSMYPEVGAMSGVIQGRMN